VPVAGFAPPPLFCDSQRKTLRFLSSGTMASSTIAPFSGVSRCRVYLYELGVEHQKRPRAYLDDLAANGLSREPAR
jgi:hypothetical protein